eukprot:SAG31_NODE_171_length_21415_cov_7.512807_7_plen_138_part_00
MFLCGKKDYNGHQQEGFGKFAMTVDSRGMRASTANCYLRPAYGRSNLTVVHSALARRIRFDAEDDGKPRASGVEFQENGGATPKLAVAKKEVVLSAGAIGSPHLLQVSGIGDATQLASIGVPVVVDRPAVRLAIYLI